MKMATIPNLSHILSSEECQKILRKCTNENTVLESYKISRISEKIIGFLGDHYQLQIIYATKKNSQNLKQETYFLKTVPFANANQKKYIDEMGVFTKEVLIYKNLLTNLLNVVSKPFAPRCYHVNTNCLVLENMTRKSFKMLNCSILTLDQCKSCLETVARFHAASIIFEELRSVNGKKFKINEYYADEIQESTFSFTEGHPRNSWAKSVTDCLQKLSKFYTNDNSVNDKLYNFVFNKLPELLRPSKRFRNVVNHDDLWNNNLMFNENNDCIIVDFQLARYVPPVYDVLIVLYINLKLSIINENRSMLLDHYYHYVEQELNYHSLDVNKLFPKDEFLESVKVYHLPALLESAMYGTTTFLPSEMSNKIIGNQELFEKFTFTDRSQFVLEAYENNIECKRRFDHVLIPLFEYLEKY